MSIPILYDPSEVEKKWYSYWMEHGFFDANVDESKEPFCIVIPPPNVTGVLHMGHVLNNTIQDVLVRRARMQGKQTCWVAGTDHASIATEAKVVAMLRKKGIKKSDISRDDFLKHAWQWKEKYGGLILEQLKKLGASCDWKRIRFTMEPEYYSAVIKVFIDLYNKGHIYRGLRMINWDCEAKTALSNEEVYYQEEGEISTLYSIKYQIKDTNEWIVVATQRPETIMGDTAVAVNPSDGRYNHLVGKKVIVPLIEREIQIIADDYVEKDFGSGCLKVTPAHDLNDYEIGLRHNLDLIDTINDDGTLNEKCQISEFIGKDRFEVRDEIIVKLRERGHIVGEEKFTTRIGRSERTNTVVEPKLSLQWFIKMKEFSKRALLAVENDEIMIYPAKFKNVYRHWMENVHDWCISRQLWWGHRIPAYYYGSGENDFVVAESFEVALEMAKKKSGRPLTEKDIYQDEDVLDTWASSWLWPMGVFDGFNSFDFEKGKIDLQKNKTLNYFYPTQVLVTAPDILFFWVARMIIAGYEYTGKKPFENVYLTGVVRDSLGRKMSKSLGNSPEPIDLINQYGSDAVRVGMLFCSPAGNDLLFDVKLCQQGRNFANKIWNAFRLISGWEVANLEQPHESMLAVKWFEAKFNQELTEIEKQFEKFRISEALLLTYKLVWDDFCARYLELIKPAYGQPIDKVTHRQTIDHFESILKMLHPFMPFISESIWHALQPRDAKDGLIVASWPATKPINEQLISQGELAFNIMSEVRNIRNANGLSPKQPLSLFIKEAKTILEATWVAIIKKIVNLTDIALTSENVTHTFRFLLGNTEFFVPIPDNVDANLGNEDILKEIEYLKGFLKQVTKKLSNEKFVSSAPEEIVLKERKKLLDTEKKIKSLEENWLQSQGKN